MGKSLTGVERCQQLVEKTITALSSDKEHIITIFGDTWSEYLTSKVAGVSLWAKQDCHGTKEVDMMEKGFLVCIQKLAEKGPGEEDCYDGVHYKFQLHSAFDN